MSTAAEGHPRWRVGRRRSHGPVSSVVPTPRSRLLLSSQPSADGIEAPRENLRALLSKALRTTTPSDVRAARSTRDAPGTVRAPRRQAGADCRRRPTPSDSAASPRLPRRPAAPAAAWASSLGRSEGRLALHDPSKPYLWTMRSSTTRRSGAIRDEPAPRRQCRASSSRRRGLHRRGRGKTTAVHWHQAAPRPRQRRIESYERRASRSTSCNPTIRRRWTGIAEPVADYRARPSLRRTSPKNLPPKAEYAYRSGLPPTQVHRYLPMQTSVTACNRSRRARTSSELRCRSPEGVSLRPAHRKQ